MLSLITNPIFKRFWYGMQNHSRFFELTQALEKCYCNLDAEKQHILRELVKQIS